VIETERTLNGKTSTERRLYIGSIPADATTLTELDPFVWTEYPRR
jgi:hypothetical protein